MRLLISVLAALVLSGCASFGEIDNVQLATKYATLKFIERGSDPAERAAKVREVVGDVKRFLYSETATLPELKSLVMAREELVGLSAADRLLVSTLVDSVVYELTGRVGTGVIPSEQVYKVDQVLAWVLSVL